MSKESCVNCLHLWVCGLQASSDPLERCPGFLDKDRCKEVTYARWIIPDDNYPDTCTNCRFEYVHYDDEVDYKPNYCPNCGALMIFGDLN